MNDGEFISHGQENNDGMYFHWSIIMTLFLEFTQKFIVKIIIGINSSFSSHRLYSDILFTLGWTTILQEYFTKFSHGNKTNSPVEFLIHLEEVYTNTCYIPLERVESQDLKNQQGQFCKVGKTFYRPEHKCPKSR